MPTTHRTPRLVVLSLLLAGLGYAACSSGLEQQDPKTPSAERPAEESDHFNSDELSALGELLDADVKPSAAQEDAKVDEPAPAASNRARKPASDLRPDP